LSGSGESGELNIPDEEFYSKKLTNKIVQQIQDPLVLASNACPEWCEQLTMWCPMLFPFETRQLYFTCTAFGASRYNIQYSTEGNKFILGAFH
jgi:E3 ubiquitin-protein ligase HECTD1